MVTERFCFLMSVASPQLEGSVPTFAQLGVLPELVSVLARRGIDTPFPIQVATIPDALARRDVLGRGQTGSGKTMAFGLPLVGQLSGRRARPTRPLSLVLVPTRELAMQVHDALEPLGRAVGLRLKVVVGGTSFPKQIDALRRGVEIVVATPGRLSDLIRQGACNLEDVEITVLDEADHMADMGFLPAVSELLDMVKPGGQRLLFSATLDRGVDGLVRKYLDNPVTHSVAPATASVDTMDHHLLLVAHDDKAAVTAEIAGREGRTIMFVRTKHGADRLTMVLRRQGVPAGVLHGGRSQNARTKTLAEFREGSVPVLVATDVAARGIHVDDVGLVVHVDPPGDSKDYLHRAGRTARAGETGTVVTLVLPHQEREVDSMTRKAGVKAMRTKVRPGDRGLGELTGARRPSGIPLPQIPAGGEATSRYGSARPSTGVRPQRTGAPARTGSGRPSSSRTGSSGTGRPSRSR
jgi:superfamily II DNA/RNA helicase